METKVKRMKLSNTYQHLMNDRGRWAVWQKVHRVRGVTAQVVLRMSEDNLPTFKVHLYGQTHGLLKVPALLGEAMAARTWEVIPHVV